MTATISLGIGWTSVVREGEADAIALMRGAGTSGWEMRGFGEDEATVQQRQLDVLGATRQEFDEMMMNLTERHRRTPFWRRRTRRAIVRDYARLQGFTTAMDGLTITWR